MARVDQVEQYIEEDPHRPGPADARLRESGVNVWILVAQLPGVGGDVKRLAADYHLPVDAVEAALAYYRRHKFLIDAQIALNAA